MAGSGTDPAQLTDAELTQPELARAVVEPANRLLIRCHLEGQCKPVVRFGLLAEHE